MKPLLLISVFCLTIILLTGCVSQETDQPVTPPIQPDTQPSTPDETEENLTAQTNQSANTTTQQNESTQPTDVSADELNESTQPTELPMYETVPPQTKEFNMTAKQWEFIPNTITVNKGDTVVLHIESVDVDHGFAISEFGVDEFLAPGKTVDITLFADKSGTYTFYCNVYCGSGHGSMSGKLIVEE
jgi:cytochrome c oxidase subunit 2